MGIRLKELRKKRKITQHALAGHIGLTQQTVSRLENQIYIPPVDLVVNIANYFDVSVDYLLELSEIPERADVRINIEADFNNNYDFIIEFSKLNKVNRSTLLVLLKHLGKAQDNSSE